MVPDSQGPGVPVPAGLQQGPGALSRFLYAAGANLPTPSGLLGMMRNMTYMNPSGLGPSGGVVQGFADDAATHPAVQLATSQHLAADTGSQAAGLAGFNANSIASDYRNSDYAGMAGDVLSPAAQLLAGLKLGAKADPAAASVVGDATNALVNKAKTQTVERAFGYKSPVIDQSLQNASQVATAIRPPTGNSPNLEQNIASNLPLTKDYAARTGNPLHSQWEAADAVRGLGK
jgi:hypothetical protein